ncbi:MAG: oxidoreductase [Gemmatales bacterium]|nr:MAG: oxidoreductase [Gemmatales bacterium]
MRYLITGASGFIGGHVAEACRTRGHDVCAFVRPTSDVAFLEQIGASLVRGQFGDKETDDRALADADVVVHCAAKVGDRGPADEYRKVNVEALQRFLDSCVRRHQVRPLHRFIHMSSLGVYEARHHYGTDETEPLPDRHMDGYTQSKVEADKLVLDYIKAGKLPIVILRPGFVYGPRDRAVLPRIIQRMTRGKIHFLGADKRLQNTIYVGNLVDAVFLAAENPKAVGQIYNLTDGERITKEHFFNTIASEMGLPTSKQILPRWLAAIIVALIHRHIRRFTAKGKDPWISPAQFKFLQLNLDFSIEKAKRELGYQPAVGFDEGMKKTISWYKESFAASEPR